MAGCEGEGTAVDEEEELSIQQNPLLGGY
jgi:hypothetical protein